MINKLFYQIKPFVPRKWQIAIRKHFISYKWNKFKSTWPIDPNAAKPPKHWSGWPDGKKFALVLTHDVESAEGLDRCYQITEIEESLGFRSSFNFVPGDYAVPEELLRYLSDHGFEIGVHGLHHDINPFRSQKIFRQQSIIINQYLKDWNAVGFRSPSMYHNLDMLHDLKIQYDASTFDTDPFEPQPDGVGTIFPFQVGGNSGKKGYIELPYTLPQDFLLFILMRQKNIDMWKHKLSWIVKNGGMALVITHPNYMNFDQEPNYTEYPAAYYREFLEYIRSEYEGQFWNALPRETANFWQSRNVPDTVTSATPKVMKRACILYYMKFKGSAILYREAKALREKGYDVDLICLRELESEKVIQLYDGLKLYLIQSRPISEQKSVLYFIRLFFFCLKSFFVMSYLGLRKRYDVVHVTSPPDIIVFFVAHSQTFRCPYHSGYP